MSRIDMSADRKYMVDNEWLDTYANDTERYVDIIEISKTPQNSQYLLDLQTMGRTIDFGQEQARAMFVVVGLRAGNSGGGTQLDGVMLSEHGVNDRFQNHYSALVTHPERFRRFYASGTQLRDLMWLGLGKTSHVYTT